MFFNVYILKSKTALLPAPWNTIIKQLLV